MMFRYWPRRHAIPRGWKLAHPMTDSHHGRYSVLLVKKK